MDVDGLGLTWGSCDRGLWKTLWLTHSYIPQRIRMVDESQSLIEVWRKGWGRCRARLTGTVVSTGGTVRPTQVILRAPPAYYIGHASRRVRRPPPIQRDDVRIRTVSPVQAHAKRLAIGSPQHPILFRRGRKPSNHRHLARLRPSWSDQRRTQLLGNRRPAQRIFSRGVLDARGWLGDAATCEPTKYVTVPLSS